MVVTTGGIGGNHAKVRRQWPDDTAPDYMLSGVPASVDGEFLSAVGSAGAALVNDDRMWHYGIGLWKETFLGGCLFTRRAAGRDVAASV